MRKILSVILVISMLVSCGILSSISGYAARQEYLTPAENVSANLALAEDIRNAIRNLKDDVDVSKYKIAKDDMLDIYASVVFETPDLFYVDAHKIKIVCNSSTGKVVKILPTYLFEKKDIPNTITTFNERVNQILSKVENTWTDEQKCRYFHDVIATTCEYNLDSNAGSDSYSMTAYGALLKNKAICEGYTTAFNYLLGKVDIEAHFVDSPTINHAWTMVKLNGKFYNIDLTWDDPTDDMIGRVEHKFYLVSDTKLKELTAEMGQNRVWETSMKATDTTYDSYWWTDVDTFIYILEGKTYFIDESYSDNKGRLVAYNESTKAKQVIYKVDCKWRATLLTYWKGCYSGLVYDGDFFYVNSPDKVYSLEKDGTNVVEIFTNKKLGYDLYGLFMQENDLVVEYRINPNNDGTVEKVTIKKIGDVDTDKKITINDATKIQQYLAKYCDFTSTVKNVADFNKDGVISVKDTTAIQLHLLK